MATRKKIPLIPSDASIAITAAKTLTVPLDASVSGTNTGDNATNSQYSGLAASKVDKATYDAHTVLYATTDDTPVALTVGEQTVVGRASGGNISALAIDSDVCSVSGSDDSIPSAKATKAMGDLKLPLAGGTMTGLLEARDHGTATTDEVVNVSYGTSATPPTASTTTEGSIYIQYTA